jgi:hypothetical protein
MESTEGAVEESLLDRWSRKMRDWVETAGQKTEEVARLGRCQVELLQVEWDLFRKRAALGQAVFRLIDKGELPGWAEEPGLAAAVDSIRALEGEAREKREEIREIRRGGHQGPGDQI